MSTRGGALATFRRGAGWVHLAFSALVVTGVVVQVYLIGAYVFGAGSGALDAHKSVGFIVHGIEIAVLVVGLAAWLPWPDLVLSLALAVVGTVQVALADAHRWVGGLHPLFALVVLGLAGALGRRDVLRLRRAVPAPGG